MLNYPLRLDDAVLLRFSDNSEIYTLLDSMSYVCCSYLLVELGWMVQVILLLLRVLPFNWLAQIKLVTKRTVLLAQLWRGHFVDRDRLIASSTRVNN